MRALKGIWSRASNLLAPEKTAVKRIYVAPAEQEDVEPDFEDATEPASPASPHAAVRGPSSSWLNAGSPADVKLQVEPSELRDTMQRTDTTVLPRGTGAATGCNLL